MNAQHGSKTGVLLVNLGSPASTKTRDVRRFLREFLGDPRVVNLPRPLWWMILRLFILPFRPRKSAHAYKSIWMEDGSPLTVYTRRLTEKWAEKSANNDLLIHYAMRYGQPSIASKLQTMQQNGVENIVILPLYPQYSSTTTATVFDAVADYFRNNFTIPNLQFIADYHQHPGYITAIANSIRRHWQQHGQGHLLLLSFHGLPAKLSELGDPYFEQCKNTGQLIASELGLSEDRWQLVFQSRFGRAEWLQPYCVEVLQALPKRGIRDIDVVCPGFAVDCLETLEEIAIANRELFISAGGERYCYIPALNDSDDHVNLMAELINQSVSTQHPSAHC